MVPYRTLVVDPPWSYKQRWQKKNGATGFYRMYSRDARGTECLYPTLTIGEIKALPVGDWAEADAHLYLWTTNAHIEAAHSVARAWGFEPKTMLTWEKPGGLGMGYYFRNNTEHVLFCVRGRLRLAVHNLPTAFHWKRGRHSEKPAGFYDMVELASPAPRLDVFARAHRFGWDAWGDEAYTPDGLPTPAEVAAR